MSVVPVVTVWRGACRLTRARNQLVGLIERILRIAVVVAGMLAVPAQALQIVRMTPQGEVAQVRQVLVTFDSAVIAFGDDRARAPVTVQCDGVPVAKGTGRWTTERVWSYRFAQDLPPGARCTAQAVPDLRSASGSTLTGPTQFRFNTGGPFVQSVMPYPGSRIDEDQVFILRLSGPAAPQSVQQHVWCAMQGIGERIAVRRIDGADREALLRSRQLERQAKADPLRVLTLACNRRLTPSADVQLVFGKGVATPAGTGAGTGIANTVERRFDFVVREPFLADFQCERENAQADCLPIRPLRLAFNAPVARSLAEGIRLRAGDRVFKPVFDKEAADDAAVDGVEFASVLPASTRFQLELPIGLKDDAGRSLRNAASFPRTVATGPMPPLVKFAAAPFGIVERLAESDGQAVLPVTLRNVEAAWQGRALDPVLAGAVSAGTVRDLQPATDAQIIAWYRRLQRYDDFRVPRELAAKDVQGPLPAVLDERDQDGVQSRMVSLLQGRSGVRSLDMPRPTAADPRPFEVVGIPLSPGFHVVEIASQVLGASLLDARHGAPRTMFVRTSALVTNLGVHFKLGRENALAWVTTLDGGRPVFNAQVRVSDCRGRELAAAVTDRQGIARLTGLDPQAPTCDDDSGYSQAYFVSARAAMDAPGKGGARTDLAFTWSDWHRGIEPWRFHLPTSREKQPDTRAHTVFDRSLLRAGETVSMKHILRVETGKGLAVPERRPDTLLITHVGSGQQTAQTLSWRTTATGGLSAESVHAIPVAAKLGLYSVSLRDGKDGQEWSSGAFRVEAFRLPVLKGSVVPADKGPLVDPRSMPVNVQIAYVAGGAATGLPVQVSALLRHKNLQFDGFDGFRYAPPRKQQDRSASGADDSDEQADAAQDSRIVADKLPLTLDRNGVGQVKVEGLPATRQAQDLLLEASYADPSGEVQTLRSNQTLWPSAVVAGIKTEDWVSAGNRLRMQALALDVSGKPLVDVPLQVHAFARQVTSSRKRIVGGFYAYDNHTEMKDLGPVCSGRSDAGGRLRCDAQLDLPGEVELVATATDAQGRKSVAASSVYVTRHGEVWFGGENHDRMDVLPEKTSYAAGETARFQVRMPFRHATALVAVEREGIIETQVVQLRGDDPTIALKIKPEWAPNVYVSVLSVRGRLREVPWYSFFTWGYKAPRVWWTAFRYGGEEVAPTALVDLSKPAFRLGVAEIQVGKQAHQLDVRVVADKESYPVRGKAQVTITVRQPDGRPAANAEVALAAIDEALLELMPNTSWDLLDAMLLRRAWGVETSTAQMEIIGRRHYGRKAVPAGGGGGHSASRELLDTALLWNPRLQLDAQGKAQITVPLNDALTRFRIVAVADAGVGLFGTGSVQIRATQDLQIISGLPPLVREGDQYQARFTLRNTTGKAMQVALTPQADLVTLAPQTVAIPAGESRELHWSVNAPTQTGPTRLDAIQWDIKARDSASGSQDGLKATQRLLPAVPLAVQQATLVQLDGDYALDVRPPAGALPGQGGLALALQPRLADGLPAIRDWFARYPFTCLEQLASKAIGLHNVAQWQALRAQLPTYLDTDGLASYFPPRDGEAASGSDTLTAYLLATSDEAAKLRPEFALDEASRSAMLAGLIAFAEGRITRNVWSPRKDLDVRKLAAIEALSRHGKAQARMLASITIAPNQWPTHALIDWLLVLQRMQDVPDRARRLAEAQLILRARIDMQGTRMGFSTEQGDDWWWLMQGADLNAARLLLAVMDDPSWKDDIGRLASGFIARQQRGTWRTTTANAWGILALEQFSAQFEKADVTGITRATWGGQQGAVDWSKVSRNPAAAAAGSAQISSGFGAAPGTDALRNNGLFLAWPMHGPTQTLRVAQQGAGKPWLSVQALAAVPRTQAYDGGYQVRKSVTVVQQADPSLPAGHYTRGDILRVTVQVQAAADMTWVVVSDPIPAGTSILGGGLGRDSLIATQGETTGKRGVWPAFEERSFEAYRAYYAYLPKGGMTAQYTIRLNNAGRFVLPPTRVEALYAPEMFGESPNLPVVVEAPR